VARDAAARDGQPAATSTEEKIAARETAPEVEAKTQARAHAAYLSKAGERALFYDALSERLDGVSRAEAWAQSDRRHFRVVLSPENGAKLADLPAYTREVMARAGASLGTRLSWIAVDHHDTDNPHTHIIIRGRRANGQDLVLPKDFIRHGFRSVARDIATEWLGPRSPADERLALDREVSRHAPTRLDRMIEAQLPAGRTIRIARLEAPNGDPSTTLALKGRARELERMGLAREIKRNVLAFESDWRGRLRAMELHLDIRKRIVHERMEQQQANLERSLKQQTRGLLGR
jgi:type IV secretory pathway VirD2 relaxase